MSMEKDPKIKKQRQTDVVEILDKFIDRENGILLPANCAEAIDDYYTDLVKKNYPNLLKP
jgi:hypothetical protein